MGLHSLKAARGSQHLCIWHKLRIVRYAHVQWLSCHGRLNTLARLASFGINLMQDCTICVGGMEHIDHLFVTCTYSSYVMHHLANLASGEILTDTWNTLLLSWSTCPDIIQRHLFLLIAQTFYCLIWRERNARMHGKGCFGPRRLINSIVLDVKSRLASSTWFIQNRTLNNASWLDL